jgi:hypothetical protein
MHNPIIGAHAIVVALVNCTTSTIQEYTISSHPLLLSPDGCLVLIQLHLHLVISESLSRKRCFRLRVLDITKFKQESFSVVISECWRSWLCSSSLGHPIVIDSCRSSWHGLEKVSPGRSRWIGKWIGLIVGTPVADPNIWVLQSMFGKVLGEAER